MNLGAFLKDKFITGRTAGFYVGLASAVIMVVSDIAYIAADFGDRTFSILTFVLILVGGIVEIGSCFSRHRLLDCMPLVSCILYGVGFGNFLYLGLPTVSDVWNGVNFIGGNANAVMVFGVLFGVGLILALVASFMRKNKTTNTASVSV